MPPGDFPISRRRSLCVVAALCSFAAFPIHAQVILDLATIRPQFENHFESRRLQGQPYGQYKMRAGDSGPSYYASLDVAIARTIMGQDFQTSLTAQQRSDWISHLQTYARPDGTYSDTFGHRQLHANGMTIGALGPLGGKQLYPATPLYAPFDEPHELPHYLTNNINWTSQWTESHSFWGGLHMFSQSSRATTEWTDAVFTWLDSHVDRNTGWWIIGQQPASSIQGLGGGAHIWPIYEHFGHAFPAPERVIDRILSMQVASGRFGGNNSGYMDLDALYGLKYMRSLSPTYRVQEIDAAAEKFGDWLTGNISSFLTGDPTMHEVLAKVGGFGLLNQLLPDRFPDSSGTRWTDIFTDRQLYQTASVETFSQFPAPVGADPPDAYSAVILSDAPVAYWRLGQTGGVTALEEMGTEKLNGYYVGLGSGSGAGHLGQSGPRPMQGYPGLRSDNRAAHLNGSNSNVTAFDADELDITGALTLEAWIKLDAIPAGNAGIVAKYLGAGNQRSFLLYVNGQGAANGGLGMVISPDGTFTNAADLTDPDRLPLGEWLHVAGTFEPGESIRLFLNGTLIQELIEDVPTQVFSSTADLWMGLQFDSSAANHLAGLIDEVALYDRALRAQEILEHYLTATILAGDYNHDDIVDAADYVIWRKAMGAGTTIPNDTTPTLVSQEDYELWKSNFGGFLRSTVIDVAAIPEPHGGLIAVLNVIAFYKPRKRSVINSN